MTTTPRALRHRPHCTRPEPQVTVTEAGTKQVCPECHRYTFVAADAPLPPLTTTQARDLAADLIRDLTPHAGDVDAVREVLFGWLETEDVARLSLICMAAVQTTFADCLTRVAQVPPGALSLDPPPTERTAA